MSLMKNNFELNFPKFCSYFLKFKIRSSTKRVPLTSLKPALNMPVKKTVQHCICMFITPKRGSLLLSVPFLSSLSKSDSDEAPPRLVDQRRAIKKAIQESDDLFESNKYEEATSALLPYKDSGDVEVSWRLSRAQYNLSQLSLVSEEQRRQLIFSAYTCAEQALEADDTHWAAHKWMSVLLDARSAYDGVKARVSQLQRIKNHMLRAVELNPKDATTFYMLGSWCYQIADMPWIQRKIAAAIFAAPPASSFEEALEFFIRAEEIEPKFYSQNLLMLGKTLLKLEREMDAVECLRAARYYPVSTEEDNQVRKEAEEILKKLKLKKNIETN